jgi:rhodanese-related sulfurtransferase
LEEIALSELDAFATGASEWALFDVREAGEADRGHIFGASFLPRRLIEMKVGDLVPDRATPIIVCDEGGPRAALAAATLECIGYRDVRVLRGGTAAWTAAGRDLTEGSNVPSKLFGEQVHEHDRVPQVTVSKLKAWRDEGRPHLVCDIRTPDEYAAARIPGAFGAFGVDLARVAGDLRARGVPIVVHCAGRTRSIIACQTLRELGVPQVYALENGTMGWLLAGFELEKGAPRGVLQPTRKSTEEGERMARELALGAGVVETGAADVESWLAERAAGRANVYVIDVRQLSEYLDGHVEGATAYPGGLAIQRTDEIAPVRAARTVLVDDHEARAFLTGYWMRRSGRPRVHVLSGGLAAWKASGRPLASGRGRSRPLGYDRARGSVERVAAAALAAAPAETVLYVDTSRHFRTARVPGSKWVAYGWLEARVAQHAGSKDAPLLVSCHDGVLSTFAAANLARLGYTHVRVLDGGIDAWRKHGLAIESGWPPELPAADDLVLPPYDSSLESMARYLDWERKLTTRRRAGVSIC